MTTTTPIDARLHATAIRAAIADVTGDLVAYDYGTVPGADGNTGALPDIYALLTVERRAVTQLRQSATTGRTGWRATVRVVGRTPNECRWATFQATTALNEARLALGADVTTPIQLESEQNPELDDGRYSGLSIFTYSL